MMNFDLAEQYDMLPRGARILCAVSGGADSMCLLHWLLENRTKLAIELVAAHYEHGLRGEESLRDCRFVEECCHALKIDCVTQHGDVAAYASEKGLGTEEAARALRYAFLEKTADEQGCTRIATAHNADDNAETMLFNLCRGGGTAGLSGIPPVRGRIVRPLLAASRTEIERWLAERGIAHVEDSSNASDDYSRNLIRHRILPVMRELNPAFESAAFRAAELLRQDENYLDGLAGEFIDRFSRENSLPLQELKALDEAVRSRVLRRICPRALSREHVRAVTRLLESDGLAYADVPGLRLRTEQGRLYFGVAEKIILADTPLKIDQSVTLEPLGIRLKASIERMSPRINDLFKTYCFKFEHVCGNIICTGRKPGDSIRPVGRGCTKSLKSLFNEAGKTQAERDSALVFRDDAGVLSVGGLALDERAAANDGDLIIRIEIEKDK